MYDLVFTEEGLRIVQSFSTPRASEKPYLSIFSMDIIGTVQKTGDAESVFTAGAIEEPYLSIISMDITGTVQKTGGGFIGGGFGFESAAEGMAIAALLNSLSSKTNINTVIQIQTARGELFFHTSAMAAEALRMALSPAFTRLRLAHGAEGSQLAPSNSDAQGLSPGDSLVEQLGRLGTLHAQGVLSDEEFAAAKAKLLG
jgi:hypothetical protein